MRTAPKIALTLLISLLLFSTILAASYAGLFTLLETRFYQPSVVSSLEKRLSTISEALDQWHETNFTRFERFVTADSVKRSLLPNQESSDITDRERRAGELLAENPGLTGIRIIDAGSGNGEEQSERKTRRIHFSTFEQDILKREDSKIAYELYGRSNQEVPFEHLLVSDTQEPRLLPDARSDRFLYVYPFHDAYGAWRGVAVFYVTTGSAVQHLFSRNLLRLSDELRIVHTDDYALSGLLLDMPRVGTEILSNVVLDKWARNNLETGRILKTDESGWMLVSKRSQNGHFIGQIVNETVFSFSNEIRILFLAVSFLTILLVVFLLFNLRQDDLVIIRNRIRRFQIQLVQELMESDDPAAPEKLSSDLNARKHDINTRIKKGFARKIRKRHEKEIDEMLNKSWNEILTALGQQKPAPQTSIDANEIKLMLEQVLQNNAISLNLTGTPTAAPRPVEVEEFRKADEADEVEELDDVEELDELDEAGEVEELDEEEELDEPDEAGEVEELDDVEELGEPDEADEVEELDDVEELDELDEAGDVEELDDTPLVTEPVEASEVEYLEGEWEPELLEVATEDELNAYIQETFPDEVLVYNFEETPGLDTFERPVLDESDLFDDSIDASGMDFSELDEEEAEEVVYTDPYPGGTLQRVATQYAEQPVYEFLEVIGDEEPAELLAVEDLPNEEHIVNKDGIFVIAERIRNGKNNPDNSDFQDLVDSVLK